MNVMVVFYSQYFVVLCRWLTYLSEGFKAHSGPPKIYPWNTLTANSFEPQMQQDVGYATAPSIGIDHNPVTDIRKIFSYLQNGEIQ